MSISLAVRCLIALVASLTITSGCGKSDPPCTPGSAGCECTYPQACDDGLSCRWDICWGGAVPPPDTYFYTDRALSDYDDVKRLIQAHFGLRLGDHTADIGCGKGSMTVAMAQVVGPTGKVYATDIDTGALKRTRESLDHTAVTRAVPAETFLATSPRDTGLETVPDGSIHLMLMINSVYFETDESPEEARDYMARFLRKLAPGGRLVYHFDWIEPQRLTRAQLEALFISAGFDPKVVDIPMPAHIPEDTYVLSGGPKADKPKPLKRGFIAVFQRPTGGSAEPPSGAEGR